MPTKAKENTPVGPHSISCHQNGMWRTRSHHLFCTFRVRPREEQRTTPCSLCKISVQMHVAIENMHRRSEFGIAQNLPFLLPSPHKKRGILVRRAKLCSCPIHNLRSFQGAASSISHHLSQIKIKCYLRARETSLTVYWRGLKSFN